MKRLSYSVVGLILCAFSTLSADNGMQSGMLVDTVGPRIDEMVASRAYQASVGSFERQRWHEALLRLKRAAGEGDLVAIGRLKKMYSEGVIGYEHVRPFVERSFDERAQHIDDVMKRLARNEVFNKSPHTMDRRRWSTLLGQLQKRAAAGDDQLALYRLGRLHQKGRGVARDDEQAFDYLGRSAGLGYKNALRQLQRIADQGNAKAAYRLGRLYQKGQGVAQDDEQALRYIQLAAHSDYARAQYRMGKLAEAGFGSLTASTDVAREWYKRAYNAGRSKSLQALERLLAEDASRIHESTTPWMEALPGFGGVGKGAISQKDGMRLLESIMPAGIGLVVNDRGILNITPAELAVMRMLPERRAQVKEIYDTYNRLAGKSDALSFDRYYKHLKNREKEREEAAKEAARDAAQAGEEKELVAAIGLLKKARADETSAEERMTLLTQAEEKLTANNHLLLRNYGAQFDASEHEITLLPSVRVRPLDRAATTAQAAALFTGDNLETILFLRRHYAKTYAKVHGKKLVEDDDEELTREALLGITILYSITEEFRARLANEEWSSLEKGWQALRAFMAAISSGKKIEGVQTIQKNGERIWVSKRAALLDTLQKDVGIRYVHLQVLNDFLESEPTGLTSVGLQFDKTSERFVLPVDDAVLAGGTKKALSVEQVKKYTEQLSGLSLSPNVREFVEAWEKLRADKREKVSEDADEPLKIDVVLSNWYAAIRTIMIGITTGSIEKTQTKEYMKYIEFFLPRAIGRGTYTDESGGTWLMPVPALLKQVPSKKHGKQAALMREIREQYDAFIATPLKQDAENDTEEDDAESVGTVDDASSVEMSDDEEQTLAEKPIDTGEVVDGKLRLSPDALKYAREKLKKPKVDLAKPEPSTPVGAHGSLMASMRNSVNEWRTRIDDDEEDSDEEDGWDDDDDGLAPSRPASTPKSHRPVAEKKPQKAARAAQPVRTQARAVTSPRAAQPTLDFAEIMRKRREAVTGKKAKAVSKQLGKKYDRNKDDTAFTGANPLFGEAKIAAKKVKKEKKEPGKYLSTEDKTVRDKEQLERLAALPKREAQAAKPRKGAVLDLSVDEGDEDDDTFTGENPMRTRTTPAAKEATQPEKKSRAPIAGKASSRLRAAQAKVRKASNGRQHRSADIDLSGD